MRTIEDIYKEIESVPDFAGHSVRSIDYRNGYGDTPLHIVSNWGDCEAIEKLVEAGAELNALGESGFTPLHCAAQQNKPDAINKLIQLGADIAHEASGETPLKLAQSLGNAEAICALSQNIFTRQGSRKATPLAALGVMQNNEIEVMSSKYECKSAFGLWSISLAIFVAGTLLITAMDYIGEVWFNVSWLRGPDMYPNVILGYPLFLVQLIAIGVLITSGIKTYNKFRGIRGLVLGFTMVLSTSIVCFFAYILGAFWYQFEFMGRSM